MSLNHVKEYNREIREWLLKVFAFAASIPKDKLVKRACPVCGLSKIYFSPTTTTSTTCNATMRLGLHESSAPSRLWWIRDFRAKTNC